MTISRVDNEASYNRIVMGYRNVTEQVKKAQQEQHLLEEAEKAEAANRAKTNFLFNMSHDIRTPMNAIIGFTDLALKHMDDRERLEEYLKNISVSGRHLLNLINNVLEMSRIESGKLELEEKPGNMLETISELSMIFGEEAAKKNLKLTLNTDIRHTRVVWDATKVGEIFLNIVSNSVKYTPEGENISVNIREISCEKEGYARYEAVVDDTGIGISKEFLPHIFESFSRERNSTESRVMGTGLGMGIVKRLVDMMGGDIHIESTPGEGTHVTVIMEFKIVEGETPQSLITEEQYKDGGSLHGKRVLLAEDNELNCEIAKEILTDAGMYVECAADGAICVDMLSKAEAGYYDMILMDIQMPNMDGFAATRAIRALGDEKKSHIPIIAMTANAFEEDKQRTAKAGMDGFIPKPVDANQLIAVMADVHKEV